MTAQTPDNETISNRSPGGACDAVLQLLIEQQKTQRRDRFWRPVKFLIILVALAALVAFQSGMLTWFLSGGPDKDPAGKHLAVVDIDGSIMPTGSASSRNLIPLIEKAFKADGSHAVVLRINSPGGTPVQAGLTADAIDRFQDKYKKPVYVLAEDMLTSGAYLIASAADEIYVAPSTVVGSIGVITRGFGFVGLMQKLGVERRVLTAGENKSQMDPFSPVSPHETGKMSELLETIHAEFIARVKKGRGPRLSAGHDDLFSGDYWVGQAALDRGLVDGHLDLLGLKEKLGVEKAQAYRARPPLLGNLGKLARSEVRQFVAGSETPALLMPETRR